MGEEQTFYQKAEEFYKSVLREENFFKQRIPLRDCVNSLIKAYNLGEIELIDGLPSDSSVITHFDKSETSELIEKLKDFFPTEEDFP